MEKFWAAACAPREEGNTETGIPMHREIPSQVGPKGSGGSLRNSGKAGTWRAAGKASACNEGDPGSILGSGRFPWRRKWLPFPVFLPGKYHGQRSLVQYTPWGRKESARLSDFTSFQTEKAAHQPLNSSWTESPNRRRAQGTESGAAHKRSQCRQSLQP